jgi:folate-binding protein YgfZ
MIVDIEEKSSPLISFYESMGAQVETLNDVKVVKSFSDVKREVNTIYDGIALRDISHYGIVELKGKDTLDFLHRITSNSVKDLPREKIADTIFTSEKGRIIDYTKLINFEDYQILICNRSNQQKVISWIQKYVITDDVKADEANGKYGLIEIMGPQADSFATLISGDVVNALQPNSFKIVNTDGIIYFLMKILAEDGKARYWILANSDNSQRMINYISDNKGVFDFSFIGEDAYNIYRVEQGIPAAPNEINTEYNPHEVNLLSAVDFKKGCYIGQEVIARLDTYDKVKRCFSGLEFSESFDLVGKMTLMDDNNMEAGVVTSVVNSIKLNKCIGLGFVSKNYSQDGTSLSAKSESGKVINVTVRSLPFVK